MAPNFKRIFANETIADVDTVTPMLTQFFNKTFNYGAMSAKARSSSTYHNRKYNERVMSVPSTCISKNGSVKYLFGQN